MWMIVMFDIPSSDKKNINISKKFRNKLLDIGFNMMQYSVYIKYCSTKSNVEKHENYIKNLSPKVGKINIFTITNKQFQNIINIENNEYKINKSTPEEYQIF